MRKVVTLDHIAKIKEQKLMGFKKSQTCRNKV